MAPVELPYNQILNWVMARGKIPQDCNKRLLSLEQQCKGFFDKHTNLPDNVKQLQKQSNSNYTEWYGIISDVVEKLKATEEGEKVNFMGQYTYEPLYDANKILKEFHSHNIHLVSYYQLLLQQTTYNAPSIKKSAERVTKELVEYRNRKTTCLRRLKAGAVEISSKLASYNIDIEQYPFDIEFVPILKEKLIEAITRKNTELTIEKYKWTKELCEILCSELLPVFVAFVNMNEMNMLYDATTVMQTVKETAEHGMDVTVSNLNDGNSANDNYGQDGSSNINENNPDHNTQTNDSSHINIFNLKLGNASFRQKLLGELLELQTFVKTRIDELRNRSANANYIFSYVSEKVNSLVQQPLSKYEKCMDILNEAIELISGTAALRSISLLRNRSEVEKSANVDLDVFTRCCNNVTEQSSLTRRIESTEEALQKLNSELEEVRKIVKQTKSKLETIAAQIMGEKVTLFGEIDEI
ncbi:uncharacterized protein BBOV_IV010520 [Babesia bovis T2Bo]|uniref:CDK5RAP3-like protein n=1 Tax=Babesia bovis TaxID=5865 RepID=A7AS86_BABBO|nr:uncharacterized protein BBOV_IV010520 [Babesia bovis T2Bo]EDO07405.1 hypothetical protein BBOV_IV010520 [Babesia bovis T2Bo]|eukprot:XP_001610973.1 hypothetical protein [Babesia bovis T2Bo]